MQADADGRKRPLGLANADSSSTEALGELLRARRHELGLSQVALAFRSGLDNTYISRVETGKQIPAKEDFERLVIAMKLSQEQRDRWVFALQRDLLQKKAEVPEIYLRPEELLSLTTMHVDAVRQLRLDGRPQLAAAEAARYAQWARVLVGRSRTERLRHRLLDALASLLLEQAKSYMDYVLPEEAWGYTGDLIAEQRIIADQMQDVRLSLLASLSAEATLYVSGQHTDADRVCAQVLSRRKILDTRWQHEVLRASAINAGYLGNDDSMTNVAKIIDAMLKEGEAEDPLAAAFLLEGLARGQGALGQHAALETIHRAWQLLDKTRSGSHHSSLRTVQLIRTHLRVLQQLEVFNPVEFERLGNKGLILAGELGYRRYSHEIRSILARALD